VSGYSGVLSYEPSELVVTARAGTPLRELEALLAEKGQCLPFEPPHFSAAGGTVGGMVASGLSGPARVSVGSVRDYVLGVSMLNGRAEELRFGGQVMKNVAGYDVSRVMAGAMGTLGMITEVSLKVLPKAPAEATLMMAMPQAQALQQLHRWMAQPLPLNASCWVHDDSAQPAQDFLFVRLRGAQAAVEAACLRMASDVQQQGFAVSRMDNAVADRRRLASRRRHPRCPCGSRQSLVAAHRWPCAGMLPPLRLGHHASAQTKNPGPAARCRHAPSNWHSAARAAPSSGAVAARPALAAWPSSTWLLQVPWATL